MNILQSNSMLPLETKNCLDINIDHEWFITKSYNINMQNLSELQRFVMEFKRQDLNNLVECYWGNKQVKYGICYKYSTVLCALLLKNFAKKDIYVLICHDTGHNFYNSIHASVIYLLNDQWIEIDLTKEKAELAVSTIPLEAMADRVICLFNNNTSFININKNLSYQV